MAVQLDRSRGTRGLTRWPSRVAAPEEWLIGSRRELRRREQQERRGRRRDRGHGSLPQPRPASRRFRRVALPLLAAVSVAIGGVGGAAAGERMTPVRNALVSVRTTVPVQLAAGDRSSWALDPAVPGFGSAAGSAHATQARDGQAAARSADRAATSSSPAAAAATRSGAAAAGTVLVPVYWVTTSTTRSLLAREYLRVPDRGGPLLSAVHAVLEQRPLDPDYTSPWLPAGSVAVRATATGITVDLSAGAFAATGVRSETAAAGIQQLIWTATAAAQRDVPVTILVDGAGGYSAWEAATLGSPTRRDTRARAGVWIDTPQQDTRAGSPVHVTGQGSAVERTFRWTISSGSRHLGGTVTGTAAGPGPGWSQFAFDVPLPPGRYTVTVTADNPGEAEMPSGWQWPDSKIFVVG